MLNPPEALPPEAPRLDNDRYVILARVGRGGMAGVYAAWDTREQAWRAIKMLLPRHARDKGVRTRFQNEGVTMAHLSHPNLVRVFEIGAAELGAVELPYIVMELLNGGSLHRWVKANGAMPPRLALAAAIQLCQGLEHVHAAGVIHRDVKPKNVLSDDDSILKLTDFGIAQIEASGETKTGLAMGTLGYMAPEQLHDAKSVDAKSDLYALGATLWTMLTTQKPRDLFRLEDRPDLLEVVPEALRPILVRCLAYERENRPESARAVADELRSVLFELPEDPPGTPDLSMHLALPDHRSVTRESFKELAVEGKATGDTDHSSTGGDSSFPAGPASAGGRRLGPPAGGRRPPSMNARSGHTGSTLAPEPSSDTGDRHTPPARALPAGKHAPVSAAPPRMPSANFGTSYADIRRESDERGAVPSYIVAEEPRPEPLKPPPPPKPAPAPRRGWMTALFAAPPILAALAGIPIVLLLGLVGYASTGSAKLSSAQTAYEKASANLDRNVGYLDTLPDEVGALGVDATELRAAWDRWEAAPPGYERTVLAVKYVSAAEKLARPEIPNEARSHEEELVFQRLERVEKVLGAAIDTREDWEEAAHSRAGALAISIGLAPAPP
jgi:serine/threonine protein kinase